MAPEQREQVRSFRQAANLTQADLARKARVDSTKLSRFESGLVELTDDELKRVCKILNSQPGNFVQLSSLIKQAQQSPVVVESKPIAVEVRKLLRQRAGLSQLELAKRAQIGRNKLAKFEAGRLDFSPEERSRWWKALADFLEEWAEEDPYYRLKKAYAISRNKENSEYKRQIEIQDRLIASLRESHQEMIDMYRIAVKEKFQLEAVYIGLSTMYLQACPVSATGEIAKRIETAEANCPEEPLPFEDELRTELERSAVQEMANADARHDAEVVKETPAPIAMGYERLDESNKQVIASLEARVRELEEGLKESPELRAEINKLREQNATLREWLNAEVIAALAEEKASRLREKVHSNV